MMEEQDCTRELYYQLPHHMSKESIAEYVKWEKSRGATENALRRCRCYTNMLYQWLPEEKLVTKAVLEAWRQGLKEKGYSQATELNYVKGINRYLNYIGRCDLQFKRGRYKDITGQQFGYLTAKELSGEKYRKDNIWICECKCGKVIEIPATRLLTGNTLSCGCLLGEHLKKVNKYYEGTSLRQSIEERVKSTRSASGYTGVAKKGDKWKAYISYKGKLYILGSYRKLEDAVEARARAKKLVKEDALKLLKQYETIEQLENRGD